MPDKNQLYKKVLDTAPFGTLLFAYGVCIDANSRAATILNCERAQIIGTAIAEDQEQRPEVLQQLTQVVRKIQQEKLSGILWRAENGVEQDEIVVSVGDLAHDNSIISLTLYPLPSLASMITQEFHSSPMATPEMAAAPAQALEQPVLPAEQPAISIETAPPAFIESDQKESGQWELGQEELGQDELGYKELGYKELGQKQPDKKERDNPSDIIAVLPVSQHLRNSISQYLLDTQDGMACGALMLIDLDHFNSINESLGKQVGNQILERVADTLRGLCSPTMQIEQVAGDSFLLFIEDIADSAEQAREASLALANEIRCVITRPFFTESGEVIVTASVGIAVLYAAIYYGDNHAIGNADEAMQQVESAMFEAKRRGRDTVVLFDAQITRQARQRINMQSSLRKAVANQEFDLYVQPQVSTHSGEVVGGEVLLRWIHSGEGRSPVDFIPILESSGMIVDVGLWVIRTACEYLRNMLDRGIWHDNMQMAVNISPKQFHDPHLIKSLEHSLKSYDIRPDMLTLEVTENLLIDDFESVVDKMKKIRDMGTRFAIDDFGSGYSSMIYLKRLPLDILKIDREFITHLNTDKETLGLVEAIMMVAHHYGLDVVAEGVEKREVLEILRSLGCEKYQGAHFSMPVSLDKFQRLLVA